MRSLFGQCPNRACNFLSGASLTGKGILGRHLVLGRPMTGSWYGQSENVQSPLSFTYNKCFTPTFLFERFCYALTEAPYVTFCHYNSPPHVFLFHSALGKPVSPKTDEFPENFRTAFDPPPAPFSENFIAIFSANRLRRH